MTRGHFALAALLGFPLAAGCSDLIDDSTTTASFALGDSLPGTNGTTFAAAKANFNLVETQQDGLGPIFNERACGVCHSNSASGGAGQQVERRYGRLTNGVFDGMASTGGSLRQLFGIGGGQGDGGEGPTGARPHPPAGGGHFSRRRPPPPPRPRPG